jgi:lipopolysaccharide export system permease protein
MSAVRIHRYIAKEITIPTLLGLIIFTFVLLMGRILKLVELVINKGIPVGEVVKLFGYLLPSFLVITIPLAFLLGVLLGFSRLSADSETIAMKASGISLYGMLKPVLALAVVASLVTAYLTLQAGPSGNSAFRTQVFQIAASRASAGFQPRVFNDEFDGLVLYAGDIQERSGTLEGVFISDERVGTTPSIILARTGRVIPDRSALTLTLRLEDGTIHRRPSDKGRDNYQVIDFSTYDINLNLGQQLPDTPQRRKKESELSTSELQEARDRAETCRAQRSDRRMAPPTDPADGATALRTDRRPTGHPHPAIRTGRRIRHGAGGFSDLLSPAILRRNPRRGRRPEPRADHLGTQCPVPDRKSRPSAYVGTGKAALPARTSAGGPSARRPAQRTRESTVNLLNRYILSAFARIFGLALAAFAGIYLLVDFFERVDSFIEHKAHLSQYSLYFTNKIPMIVVQVAPMAVLMGVFMSPGRLSRSSELTAMRASGISLWRITVPCWQRPADNRHAAGRQRIRRSVKRPKGQLHSADPGQGKAAAGYQAGPSLVPRGECHRQYPPGTTGKKRPAGGHHL